jgi:hypothetical protein
VYAASPPAHLKHFKDKTSCCASCLEFQNTRNATVLIESHAARTETVTMPHKGKNSKNTPEHANDIIHTKCAKQSAILQHPFMDAVVKHCSTCE